MRIVMLTDDAASIDRRILLEAETLVHEGHEVIVVARKVPEAPDAARLGPIKVLWIDLDLAYFQGAYERLAADKPPTRRTLAEEEARMSALRQVMVWSGIRYMAAELDWAEKSSAVRQATGLKRMARKLRLAGSWWRKRRASAAWTNAVGANRRADVHAVTAAYEDLPDMNPWERAIFFRAIFLDPDVIHVHDLPQLLAGVYAKRFLDVPLVYDAHEVYPVISTLTPEDARHLHDKEGRLLKYCDLKITVNPFCSRLMEYCYGSEPFEIIMNATRLDRRDSILFGSNRLRERLSLGPEAKLLMYQGWIADVGRGLVQLINAFPAVQSNVHLIMMGYGEIDQFRRIAADAGVADRVHFLPPVPWDELVSWSAEADAGIIPYQPIDFNHRVCSPNKLFEFIAAGLPIVCNDLPFLRQVVEGEGFGIARPMSNSREMAEAINAVFDPRSRILETARAALLAKGEQWEWAVEAQKLKRLYAGLRQPSRYNGLDVRPRATINLDQVLS